MRPPSPYQRLVQREIYRNPWVAVRVHEIIHPTGATGEHVAIATGRASAVLVIDRKEFIFTRQPRFAADTFVIEVVKGGAGEGESSLECAQRELREELGLAAASWTPLGVLYEVPSIIEHPVVLYIARDLRAARSDAEETESIEPVRMPMDDAFRAVRDGRIDDAVTLGALLRYLLTSETAR
ncbi:MAG TPA: NUDIX hydrolase [Candidatus Acidoferrales bacterium]|nr:NUDIX hydrolase [Candidatus Acidoferrales bacterium]